MNADGDRVAHGLRSTFCSARELQTLLCVGAHRLPFGLRCLSGGAAHQVGERLGGRRTRALASLGWHYSSNATCLLRPGSFYALFVVSRIATLCQIIRHV